MKRSLAVRQDKLEGELDDVLAALRGEWQAMKVLSPKLPHIKYRTLQWYLAKLLQANLIWRREARGRSRSSTPIYEYRCKLD